MHVERTLQALAAITDEGFFERLATAILREANPTYCSLTHTGVNIAGKTVKSPIDGICFVKGADPPHMIAVHHTITARNDLEKKWLHDPSKVKPRKGPKPTAPAGDIIKTADLVNEERTQTPNLRVTLILTTNEEPDEALVRTVEAAGRNYGLEIDLWSRSRLCHFLDNQPTGQWIRHSFLDIEQEQLSAELLHELSQKSLEINKPLDNPDAWISRSLDNALADSLCRDMTFLVAGSGLGKTVACYRMLGAHVEGGGCGLILPHEVVAAAINLEQAITIALRQMHPSLTMVSASSLSFCTPERPLLLIVEDVHRSGQSQRLIEKLIGWLHVPAKENEGALSRWRLVCPLWPETLSSLGEQVRKLVEPFMIVASEFTEKEGRDAVLARARLEGRSLSELNAGEISHALGHDPLLIALHDQRKKPDPHKVISQFVEGSLSRVSADNKDQSAAAYLQALRVLSGEMLANRQIELRWRLVSGWQTLQGEPLRLINSLAHHGELIRFMGPSDDQWFSFRHDRVRDWLLVDAAAELNCNDLLDEQLMAEPYFAEVMGAVLAWGHPKPNFLPQIASLNPLALFHALRLLGSACHQDVLQAINDWLDNPVTHDDSNRHLRREVAAIMAETDSPDVPALIRKLKDRTINGQLARLRNGDLVGGIELCMHMEPGVRAPWRDLQIQHAKLRYGIRLIQALDDFLRRIDLNSGFRIGALRLAGHVTSPRLALAIQACWNLDDKRSDHLAEYLWAFGECCGEDPANFLGSVCDDWAGLSDQPDKHGRSPRDAIADHELRWAFQQWPPLTAIDYFIQRGSQDDLRWPITYMLHGIDHPKAVLFVVKEIAEIQRRLEGTGSFSPFARMAKDDWKRADERNGRPMSKVSRDALYELWQDETKDKQLRIQAFSFWEATQDAGDIEVLRAMPPSADLADKILWARLTRGDQQAIPALIKKFPTDDHGYWWQCGRYIWSEELTEALDEFLGRRGAQVKRIWEEPLGSDWITSELIMNLPESQAERILLKHWSHLRFVSDFVQTALYVSTPSLIEAAQAAINECPEPAELMKHLSLRLELRTKSHRGLTHEKQVLAFVPYLHLLSPMDIGALWEACNKQGWFAIRKEFLDNRLQSPYLQWKWDHDNAILELDKIVDEKRLVWIDHWIDDFLKTGVPWAEILATMVVWLKQRHTLMALQVVASAVAHRGTREDLNALSAYEGIPETAARYLIEDTQFAVKRRCIR
ncbi:MAG TPA: hypothetical protein PL030_09680 [Smithella sp.]|nr:hypothetical protein [Smithella sp.]